MSWTERPPLNPKHIEERLKLAGSGLQATALTLLAGVILGPALNAGLKSPTWARFVAGLIGGFCELAAFLLLAYIPITPTDKQP